MQKIGSFIIFVLFLMNCTGKQPTSENQATVAVGKVQVEFDNVVGNQDLVLGTGSYQNPLNQSFKVSNFSYYITNIHLKRANGTIYAVPQDSSYFLVRESVLASHTLVLNRVPVDEYVGISFLLGVDSLRSTMNLSKRTGVLDPATGADGHYWIWNSGYIFMRLEGSSPESTGIANLIQYHVGGFGGYSTKMDNNIKSVSLDFGTQKAQVQQEKTVRIKIKTDALKVISGAHTIDFAVVPNIMAGANAKKVAENSSQMFQLVEVRNE